jgi:hypothetical protein
MLARYGITVVTTALLILAAILVLVAWQAPQLRQRLVFDASEMEVESAITHLAERQKQLVQSTGQFEPFTSDDIEQNDNLLDVDWNSLPVGSFRFDGQLTEEGYFSLRALPRASAVLEVEARARVYAVELSPSGDVLRSGWYPP